MGGEQWAFLVLGAFTLVSALAVVTARNVFHAALSLAACFFGVAGIYLLLQAEFLAVAQVLIYVGAITVLILFGIMLTRHITGQRLTVMVSHWKWALGGSWLLLLLLVHTVMRPVWSVSADPPVDSTLHIGVMLVQEYVLAFELASVVLLAALVGAVVIARDERR